MIEAVVEDAAVKEDVCRADEVMAAEAVLASNTSSIPISTLGAATGRPDRVIGMHFSTVDDELVEVVRGKQTSDETARRSPSWRVKLAVRRLWRTTSPASCSD